MEDREDSKVNDDKTKGPEEKSPGPFVLVLTASSVHQSLASRFLGLPCMAHRS